MMVQSSRAAMNALRSIIASAALLTLPAAAYLWHRRPTFFFERFEWPSMAEDLVIPLAVADHFRTNPSTSVPTINFH